MSYGLGSRRPMSLAEKLWRVHWPMLLVAAALASIGTTALYSSSAGSFHPWAESHVVRFLLGCGLVIIMAMMPPRIWLGLAYPAYFAALGLLAAVPFLGVEALGAKRWLTFANTTFQPSEFMKIMLIAVLARYYHDLPANHVSRPLWVALPLLVIAAPVVLMLKQPDLGTAVLLAGAGLAVMFVAGVSILYFAAGTAGIAVLVPVLWAGLHDYQRRRVEVFLDPGSDPLGAGYHITQSKIALGSGGIAGKGYMQGTQSQLNFVPEKHTDFVFAMLGEEWGFAGAMAILALFAVLIALVFFKATRVRHTFGRLVMAGFGMILFMYVFINIGMVTGLVPVVGVPLPLVSYGGTSMLSIMVGLGLAMSAHVHDRDPLRRDEYGRF